MKKRIFLSILMLLGMAVVLAVAAILFRQWQSTSFAKKACVFCTMLVWIYLTYNLITFRFRWMKK